ncbi:unnamed protein product [Adineta steineri]|uniref:Nuclear receptor n=1 Tax=Adineta steineri TaxID=433720 RepID=A0A815GKB3_9BILA|nr:unnamed protein product [Adineta steineri]CAF3759944.1 unnamed protein product [Adineta steineri]
MANISSSPNDDLFKKFKLKYDRTIQLKYESDTQINTSNSNANLPINIDDVQQHSKNNNDNIISSIHNHKKSCSVCNGTATGFHYGLRTCEGCKGFFRRAVQNNKKYRCNKNGLCIIDKSQRNFCQYCRYEKCLSKGMTISTVRCHRAFADIVQPYKYKTQTTEQMNNNSNVVFNKLFDINAFYDFNQTCTLDVLFSHLQSLVNNKNCLTKESIRKISCLLIDTFINWYRSLPYYSAINLDFNQFILNNCWSSYIILVIFYFLKVNYNDRYFLSYEKYFQRLFSYTQNDILLSLTSQILDQLMHILKIFFTSNITNIEFFLLNILLVFQSDQLNDTTLDSMEEIYMKILYTYEINTFPVKQSCRYNQLLDLSKQIRLLTQILLTHEHFYLPFLLIPN